MADISGSFKATAKNSDGDSVLTKKLYAQVYWTAANDDANLRWKISVYVKLFSYSISWSKTTNASITVGSDTQDELTAVAASYSGSSFRSQDWVGSKSKPIVFYKSYDENNTINISFSKAVSVTYSGVSLKKISGSGTISLPPGYTAPEVNNVSVARNEDSKTTIKPTDRIKVSWDAQPGTNNEISGYNVYYKLAKTATAPTITDYTYMEEVGAVVTETTIDVSNLTRGYYLVVGVVAKGEAGDNYNSTLKSTTSLIVNSLPDIPTISASDTSVEIGSTVNFVLSSTDMNTTQSLSYYYSTSATGEKEKIDGNELSHIIENVTTFYFWSYDGLEYSNTYNSIMIAINGEFTPLLETALSGAFEEKNGYILTNSDIDIAFGHIGGESTDITNHTLQIQYSNSIEGFSNPALISTLKETTSQNTSSFSQNYTLLISNINQNYNYFRIRNYIEQSINNSNQEEIISSIYSRAEGLNNIDNISFTWIKEDEETITYPNTEIGTTYINNSFELIEIDISTLYFDVSNIKKASLKNIEFYFKNETIKSNSLIVNINSEKVRIPKYSVESFARGENLYFYCIVSDVLGQTTILTNYGSTFNIRRVPLPIYNSGGNYSVNTDFNYYNKLDWEFLFPMTAFYSSAGLNFTYDLYISSINAIGNEEMGLSEFTNFLIGSNLSATQDGNSFKLNLTYDDIKDTLNNSFTYNKNMEYTVSFKLVAIDDFGNQISSDNLILNNNIFTFRSAPTFNSNNYEIRNTYNTSANNQYSVKVDSNNESSRTILPNEYCILKIPSCSDNNSTDDLEQYRIELIDNNNSILQTSYFLISDFSNDEITVENKIEYYYCNFKMPASNIEDKEVYFKIYIMDKSGLETNLESESNLILNFSRFSNFSIDLTSETIDKNEKLITLGYKINDFGFNTEAISSRFSSAEVPAKVITQLLFSLNEDLSNSIELNVEFKESYNNFEQRELTFNLSDISFDENKPNPLTDKTFMKLTVKFLIGYNGENERYSESSLIFISYADGATVAYRKHSLGINVENPEYNDVLTIQQYGVGESAKKYIRFIGTNNKNENIEIFLDLSTGVIDGIIIDGGDW